MSVEEEYLNRLPSDYFKLHLNNYSSHFIHAEDLIIKTVYIIL